LKEFRRTSSWSWIIHNFGHFGGSLHSQSAWFSRFLRHSARKRDGL